MVNPELLRYRADGGGQAAVLERPAECLAEEDDSLKHWPGSRWLRLCRRRRGVR